MKKVAIFNAVLLAAISVAHGATEECRDDRAMSVLENDAGVMAQNVRAWRYFNGVGVPADRKTAIELWKKSAEDGNARAMMRLGQPWPHGDLIAGDYQVNMDLIAQAAEKKDLLAIATYARAYLSGQIGGASGARQGLTMAEHAAEQGSVLACAGLAEFYGSTSRRRPAEAKLWTDRALLLAKKNEKNLSVEDMTALGALLLADKDNTQNIAHGLDWLNAAVRLGDPVAAYRLAANCAGTDTSDKKDGQQQNFALARQWAGASVRGGYARGNILLAYLQLSGQGGEKDAEYAADLLVRPVEMGYSDAKHMMGMMYLTGQGVRINTWRAEKLLTESAEDGNSQAMWDLVRIYRDGGMGLARDQEKAATWLQRAYEKGHPEAKAAVEAFQKKQTASQPATQLN